MSHCRSLLQILFPMVHVMCVPVRVRLPYVQLCVLWRYSIFSPHLERTTEESGQ